MAGSQFSRKLDSLGRIMIPVKIREQLNMETGKEYYFEIRSLDGRKFICIDCGKDTDLENAIKVVEASGKTVVD